MIEANNNILNSMLDMENKQTHDFDDGFDKELENIVDHLNKTGEACMVIELPENPKLKNYAFMIMPIKTQ